MTDIADDLFDGCNSLERIEVNSGNQIYDSRDDCNAIIETESNTLISGCCNTRIPDSVNSIGSAAFSGYSSLTSITIPESVTSIKSNAFRDCSSLVSITIPESVTHIYYGAFSGCSSLTNITIPEGVISIGSSAFYDCNNLVSITIPDSVTSIGEGAFNRCADDFVISVIPGSYAETYAKENDIPYHYIEESEHTHSYQNQITTQPGCTTAGVRTYTCSGCEDSYTEEIAATGHKYTKTTTDPTCTAKGVVTYTCSVCKNSYKEEIAATGHKYTKTTTNPTCTINGVVTCTCSVCKHSYIEKTLPATGHKYVTTTVAATMEKNGAITTSCAVCKEKKLTTIDAPRTVSLSKTESIYNGKQQKPGVTVKDEKGKTLRNGSDYTVSYQKDMKNVGIHVVTVNFKGNYSGKTEMFFAINPKGTSISKAVPEKKGFELKWKKQTSQITGYEIAYSTSSAFSAKSTRIVTIGRSKTSVSVTNPKAKKKYYVRIRTYKTVKGNKYYSGWSKVKNVTTKK